MKLPVEINEATARLLLSYCLRNKMTTGDAIAGFIEEGLTRDAEHVAKRASVEPRTKYATTAKQLCIKTIYKVAEKAQAGETFRFEDLLSQHQLDQLSPGRLSSWRYNFHRWAQKRCVAGTLKIEYFTGFVEPVYSNRAEPLAPIP